MATGIQPILQAMLHSVSGAWVRPFGPTKAVRPASTITPRRGGSPDRTISPARAKAGAMRGKPALSAEAARQGSTRTRGLWPVTASTAASAKLAQFQCRASKARASAADSIAVSRSGQLASRISPPERPTLPPAAQRRRLTVRSTANVGSIGKSDLRLHEGHCATGENDALFLELTAEPSATCRSLEAAKAGPPETRRPKRH
jgi:hypothetical protein